MRIAFLGPSHPWRGGISQFAQNLACGLVKEEHSVMMFTFIHQYPELLFPGSEQKEPVNLHPELTFQQVLTPYNILTWPATINSIKDWKPDVLIISFWIPIMAPAFGYILRKLHGIRKMYLIHNIDSHEKWLLGKALTRYALKAAYDYLTLSHMSTKALMKLCNNISNDHILPLFHPVYEVPHTTDNLSDANKMKLLFFGFIKPYKGLDVLLHAMATVVKTLPELKLIIAGDVYGDKKIYYDLIDSLKLRNNLEIHFRYIPDDEIESFFQSCDVCVLPYKSATQSGVIQLSFAYEVPVIATQTGGIEEVVHDKVNGLLVEPENQQALAEKILEFYQNINYIDYREKIRQRNIQYSWKAFTLKLLKYLK